MRNIIILAVCALMLALVGGVAGWLLRDPCQSAPPQPDIVTVHTTDTMLIVSPPDTVTLTEVRIVKVAVYDTVTVKDSVDVELPFEHHLTSIDNVVDIYHSGYLSRVDSVVAYRHHTTIISNIREVAKMPRLTLEAGAGAMWQADRIQPYALAALRYNADRVTWGAWGAANHEGAWGAGLSLTYRFNIIK